MCTYIYIYIYIYISIYLYIYGSVESEENNNNIKNNNNNISIIVSEREGLDHRKELLPPTRITTVPHTLSFSRTLQLKRCRNSKVWRGLPLVSASRPEPAGSGASVAHLKPILYLWAALYIHTPLLKHHQYF
eukprot:gene9343-6566_t